MRRSVLTISRPSLRIALIYALFSVLWILGSDRAVHQLLPQYEQHTLADTIKGIFFVLFSALLIYILLRRELAKQAQLNARVAGAESRLRQVTDETSDIVFVYDMLPSPRISYVSPSVQKITGYQSQDYYQDPELGYNMIYPDDRHLLELSANTTNAPVILRWIRKDGKTVYIQQKNVAERDTKGNIISISGIGRDVSAAELARLDLELLNKSYTVLWRINRLIVREKDIENIYAEACRIPLTSGDFLLVTIGIVDAENNAVHFHYSEGSKQSYLEGLQITLDDTETGRGPCGLAARTGEAQCSMDIATDPTMLHWRVQALAHGFHSAASFPIKIGKKVVAVWTLYSPVSNYFSQQVQTVYGQLAGDISFALETRTTESERVRLEVENTQSKERYARLIEQLPVIVYEATRDAAGKYKLEFLSANALLKMPVKPELLSPEHLADFDFIHPQDRDTFFAAEKKSLSEMSRFDWRGRVILDGETRYVRMQSSPEMLENGAIRSQGIIEDETLLHKAREQAQASEMRFQAALEATGDGLWDWNTVTNQIYFSTKLSTMLGYTPEEWGYTLADWESRVHPDDLDKAKRAIQANFEGKTDLYSCEMRMRCRDGTHKWILDRGKVIERDGNGKPLRMIGLQKDLTSEMQIRASIAEREEYLNTIISQAPVGIAITLTGSAEIISANPKFCEILGRSESEILQLNWKSLTHADDVEANETYLAEMIAGRTNGFMMQKRFLKPDGSTISARLTVSRLEHAQSTLPAHIAIIEDLTQSIAQEERLRKVFDESPIGIAIIDSDTGEIVSANPMYARVTGRSIAELQQLTWKDFTYPDDISADQALMDELNSGKRQDFQMKKRLLKPDGTPFWIRMKIAKLTHYHSSRRVHVCMLEDIDDIVASEAQLRLHAAVIENTREGVVITDQTPKIVSVNTAYTTITGYSAEEAIGKNPNIVSSGRQHALFYAELWAELKQTGRWQGELYNRRKNGEFYPQLSTIDTIYDANGKAQYYVGVFSDISRLKKSQQSFERLAHYDVLTGLPNRLLVTNRLSHALDTAKRSKQIMAVIFLDLDHFKNVNDSLGHEVGDELLISVAGRLKKRLRMQDTVGRLGGDEFLIIAENVESPNGAAILARDLLTALSAPFVLSTGHSIYTAGSLGICMYPQDGQTTAELIRNADAALYLAKSEGRNTFRFYTNKLTAVARRRLALEVDLRGAITNRLLKVVYQPVVDVQSGAVVGAEALCRWTNRENQQISPAEFIPVAEETGLIVPLGLFVLETACKQAALWAKQNARFTKMAVNVSVRQFQEIDWQQRFTEILTSSGLAPQILEIEITESALMQKGNEALAVLQFFKNCGIRVAIDDFGTGYSSLSYLQRFSVDTLKIDQSFVRDLSKNTAGMQLVRTIIALARNLNLTTLAEGVEDEEQLLFLRAEGASLYQGYLKSPGIDAEKFAHDFL